MLCDCLKYNVIHWYAQTRNFIFKQIEFLDKQRGTKGQPSKRSRSNGGTNTIMGCAMTTRRLRKLAIYTSPWNRLLTVSRGSGAHDKELVFVPHGHHLEDNRAPSSSLIKLRQSEIARSRAAGGRTRAQWLSVLFNLILLYVWQELRSKPLRATIIGPRGTTQQQQRNSFCQIRRLLNVSSSII